MSKSERDMRKAEFEAWWKVLHCMDRNEVAFLTAEQWASFRADPGGFMVRADDQTSDWIWLSAEVRRERGRRRMRGEVA